MLSNKITKNACPNVLWRSELGDNSHVRKISRWKCRFIVNEFSFSWNAKIVKCVCVEKSIQVSSIKRLSNPQSVWICLFSLLPSSLGFCWCCFFATFVSHFDVSNHLHNVSVWRCGTIAIDLLCIHISNANARHSLCERIKVWNWLFLFTLHISVWYWSKATVRLFLFELRTKKKKIKHFSDFFFRFFYHFLYRSEWENENFGRLFRFGRKIAKKKSNRIKNKTFPYSLIIIIVEETE